MSVLVLDHNAVRELLPMHECIDLMAAALAALGRGEAIVPLRPILAQPDKRGVLAMMPAYLAAPPTLGLKVITFFPGNLGTPYDPHQGAVLLFDTTNGSLQAILDASSLTAIRTAAVSGVATRLLARRDATRLGLVGTGIQARTHLEAMLAVRDFRQVRIWGRDAGRAAAFAAWARLRHDDVAVVPNAADAVRDADVVCTVTSAREPVLDGAWIAAGAHLNVVGSSARGAREVDTAAVVRSRLFVDRRESALSEAGDFLIPKQEGAIGDDHILGEIGELLAGSVEGRRSPDEVTMFKSLGLAVEDLAAAQHVYRRALQTGAGTAVELGGARHEW